MERIKQNQSLIIKIILGLVIALSVFTHLFAIGNTYIFQNDEARDALIALKMIEAKRPVLLGPETSVGNMYLGPFYYYLMVIPLQISGLDPIGPAIMTGVFGIITTLLIFILGKREFGAWAAIFAALFYSISPIMLHHSRSSWNPNVIPFFVTLLLLIPNLKKPLWQLCFGALTGIIFQLHYVALILPALIFLVASYKFLRTKEYLSLIKFIGIIILGFLITSSPFWLFELRHSFVNTSAFITYLTNRTSVETVYPPYLNRFWSNINLLINGVFYSSSLTAHPHAAAFWSALILFFGTLIFRASSLIRYMFFSIIILSFLKENINVHYLAFLFPIVAVWFGSLFATTRIVKVIALSIFLYSIFLFTPSLKYAFTRTENAQVKRSRETAAYIVKQANGRPYNVVGSQGTFTNTISYFLAISDNPPRNDIQNLVFDICTGGPCSADEETTVLLFLTGPSHPSLIDYLGHPAINEFNLHRRIIKNEWVSYDIYVATINLSP